VVEGVETEAQLVMIRENQCADLIEGYIFGTPMPRGAFSELAVKLSEQGRQPLLATAEADHPTRPARSTR